MTETKNKSNFIIVTGATSLIGHYLLPHLRQYYRVQAISRIAQQSSDNTSLAWHTISASLAQTQPPLMPAEVAIHLAPIWLLPDFIPALAELGVKRLIAFSSTSRFTKQASQHPTEQQVVHDLISAEQAVSTLCEQHQIAWTIFRPTLIYGDYDERQSFKFGKALATVARLLKRLHFFPLIGTGAGLRQPVHADDLALACMKVLKIPATFNKAYNLSGAEVINYRQMIERIFLKLQLKARFVHVPQGFVRLALSVFSVLPKYKFLTPEMAKRMNQDMVFDHQQAKQDFSYSPRKFLE